MASQIQPLPEEIIYLIAAGEVIDSLEAVVRELVENALDAQATRISVSVWPEQWRIQVADNGIGMDVENLKRAATAHSTSKISTIADLSKITSLGFRGEALHSLAQLAQLEILSRPPGDMGWRVVYNHQGEPSTPEAVAIAPGTIVTVSELFENWKGRRQALPSFSQQLRSIHRIISQIALCHPHVNWQVRQGSSSGLQIISGIGADSILPQIVRGVRLGDLQRLQVELTNPTSENTSHSPSLKGVLGLPDRCHRHRPDWVQIALNGRIVRSQPLEQTILSAFSRTLPRDRFPVCFIHLQIDPTHIDWNRHPAKEEVYLHHLNYWQEQITNCIDHTLRLNPTTAPAKLNRVDQLLKVSEEKGSYHVQRSIQPTKSETTEELSLIELKAIAQVHNTYIVAEHPNGLWLIEQHIAHERVLYEQLLDTWQRVSLDPPILLPQLSPTQLEQLERIGLQVDPFGDELWAVRTAPELLSQREDCQEALIELSLGKDLESAQVATACRSAIRNGTPLNLPEMQTLLEQWVRTRNPRTCPHGRPIFLRLDESSLSKFFRRHWVIGKSHGI